MLEYVSRNRKSAHTLKQNGRRKLRAFQVICRISPAWSWYKTSWMTHIRTPDVTSIRSRIVSREIMLQETLQLVHLCYPTVWERRRDGNRTYKFKLGFGFVRFGSTAVWLWSLNASLNISDAQLSFFSIKAIFHEWFWFHLHWNADIKTVE